ncbi:MAG: 50S ribosomal protein L18 [Halobacteriota archaeon]
MATGPRYNVPFRRRREGKTNYRKRLGLLLSKKSRVVVRKSSCNLIMQLVEHNTAGDKTLVSANALDLKKVGYKGATGNTPAAYLTGVLFARRALTAGYSNGVLDLGLNAHSGGSRIYAALMGAVEGGMDIPFSQRPLPTRERARGEHIAAYASDNLSRFSHYGIDPKDLPAHVDLVKQEILDRITRK